MSKKFKGTINLDIRDSEADWTPYEQPIPPDGAPNVDPLADSGNPKARTGMRLRSLDAFGPCRRDTLRTHCGRTVRIGSDGRIRADSRRR